MSAEKKFLFNSLPVLGSWEAEAGASALDVEEAPASLLVFSSSSTLSAGAAAVLQRSAARKSNGGFLSEPNCVQGEERESELSEIADDFIALADSPSRQDAPLTDDRFANLERRAAQQAASELLAKHRKQQMPWMSDAMPHVSSPLLRLHTGEFSVHL